MAQWGKTSTGALCTCLPSYHPTPTKVIKKKRGGAITPALQRLKQEDDEGQPGLQSKTVSTNPKLNQTKAMEEPRQKNIHKFNSGLDVTQWWSTVISSMENETSQQF